MCYTEISKYIYYFPKVEDSIPCGNDRSTKPRLRRKYLVVKITITTKHTMMKIENFSLYCRPELVAPADMDALDVIWDSIPLGTRFVCAVSFINDKSFNPKYLFKSPLR